MRAVIGAVVLGVLLSTGVWACDKGCTEYEGVCACDIPSAAGAVPSVQPSDEKPSKHPEPAWQRGEVNIVDVPSFKSESEEADAQIKFANNRHGQAAQ